MLIRDFSTFSIITTLLCAVLATASPNYLTVQSRISKPSDAGYLEASNVQFRFTLTDPVGTCVVYQEDFTNVDMTGSKGLISMKLGSGVKAYPAGAMTMKDVFSNFSAPVFNCQAGGTYTAASTDQRKLIMQFNDGSGWQTVPSMEINSIPFSLESMSSQMLGSYPAADYVRSANFPTCVGGEALHFNGTNFTCVAVGGAATSVAAGAGTVGSPSISFSGDTNTGIYSGVADVISISNNGANSFNISGASISSTTTGGGLINQASGAAATPTFSFTGDPDTGWFRPAADTLAASTAGAERFRIDSAGNVGIGTSTPSQLLSVGSGEQFRVNGIGDVTANSAVIGSALYQNVLVTCSGCTPDPSGLFTYKGLYAGMPYYQRGATSMYIWWNSGFGSYWMSGSTGGTANSWRSTIGLTTPFLIGWNPWSGGAGNPDSVIGPTSNVQIDAAGNITAGGSLQIQGSAASSFAGNVGIGTTSPAVSLDIGSKTDAARLPNGTTAQRPTCNGTTPGAMRYNSQTTFMEYCDGSSWYAIPKIQPTTPPTTPSGSGYFVLTDTAWDGNLGGLAGADAKCLTELGTTYTNWSGYADANARGLVTASKIKGFICTGAGCNNLTPLGTYIFSVANDPGAGGASFTVDASGLGPNDSAIWSAANRFNTTAEVWTGRSTASATAWAATATGNLCSEFTSGGFTTGTMANTSGSDETRWRASDFAWCNVSRRLICIVNP